jgi:hypothetical protein
MRILNRLPIGAAFPFFLLAFAAPAFAAPQEEQPERVALKPILDARLRHETVDQDALEADALTFRLRGGAEARISRFSLLAEAEGTVALGNGYNAFPLPLPGEDQWRPDRAVVADPENLELNRLQLQYRAGKTAITLGRQRINLDDQRWVGSVAWRQNEQTFDAIRGETQLGPLNADVTYAISQRTIFGEDAGPRTSLDGDFLFAGLSSKLGPLQGKLFAYLLDYDEPLFLPNSSQTYGGLLNGSVPLGGMRKLAIRASYARQRDHGDNPFDYAADYWSFEGGTRLAGLDVAAGWEQLASNRGRAVQTPMATLHKFNGWADLFLMTPATGLEDAYVTIGWKFDRLKLVRDLNASAAFHQFDSAAGDVEYGTEWDASLGFKLGKLAMLLKYADYDARDFGVDTGKLWLQAEWGF